MPTEADIANLMSQAEQVLTTAKQKVAEVPTQPAPAPSFHSNGNTMDAGLTRFDFEGVEKPILMDVYQGARDFEKLYRAGAKKNIVPWGGVTLRGTKYKEGEEVPEDVLDDLGDQELEKLTYRDNYWLIDRVIEYVQERHGVALSLCQADWLYHRVLGEHAKKKLSYLKDLRDTQMSLRSMV